MTDATDKAGMLAELDAYPNLQMMMRGCVSGHHTEWPAMRGELSRLLQSRTPSPSYEAGVRRAAEVCDLRAMEQRPSVMAQEAAACADDIRALLDSGRGEGEKT